MDIKKENEDEEAIVPSFTIKMELPKDSLDIEKFKTKEASDEFLKEDYSDFPTLEPIKEPMKLEPISRTSIKVGSDQFNSKLQ